MLYGEQTPVFWRKLLPPSEQGAAYFSKTLALVCQYTQCACPRTKFNVRCCDTWRYLFM